jgi:hypothetical protein
MFCSPGIYIDATKYPSDGGCQGTAVRPSAVALKSKVGNDLLLDS